MTMKRLVISTATLIAALGLVGTAQAGDAAAGKTVFDANCSSCHGTSGKGDGPVGSALNPPPRNFAIGEFKFDANADGKPGEDADLKLVIQKGAMAFGGSALMAPWPTMTETQIDDMIAHIRSLKE
jgi:mono/diheme cytochrome c family protein